jgi:hypothetical protein
LGVLMARLSSSSCQNTAQQFKRIARIIRNGRPLRIAADTAAHFQYA